MWKFHIFYVSYRKNTETKHFKNIRSLFGHFWEYLAKIMPQICTAAYNFTRALLSQRRFRKTVLPYPNKGTPYLFVVSFFLFLFCPIKRRQLFLFNLLDWIWIACSFFLLFYLLFPCHYAWELLYSVDSICLVHMAAFLSAVSLHLKSLFLLLFYSFVRVLKRFEISLPVPTLIRNWNWNISIKILTSLIFYWL